MNSKTNERERQDESRREERKRETRNEKTIQEHLIAPQERPTSPREAYRGRHFRVPVASQNRLGGVLKPDGSRTTMGPPYSGGNSAKCGAVVEFDAFWKPGVARTGSAQFDLISISRFSSRRRRREKTKDDKDEEDEDEEG